MFSGCGSQDAWQNDVFCKWPFRRQRETDCWQIGGLQKTLQNAAFGKRWLRKVLRNATTFLCICARSLSTTTRYASLPGGERRAKPGKPSASQPMRNGTNQGKSVCPADVACKTHREMQCLANETRRGHRKSWDLAGIACSPAPFRECGLRALRNTAFLQTSRQSMTASHCSCRCFAQAF